MRYILKLDDYNGYIRIEHDEGEISRVDCFHDSYTNGFVCFGMIANTKHVLSMTAITTFSDRNIEDVKNCFNIVQEAVTIFETFNFISEEMLLELGFKQE